jgi:sterol 3beta-glucosyltransferase
LNQHLDFVSGLQIPLFIQSAFPFLPTGQFASPLWIERQTKKITSGQAANLRSYEMVHVFQNVMLSLVAPKCRRSLGLDPNPVLASVTDGVRVQKMRIPVLATWSPHLLSSPEGYHENHMVVGGMFQETRRPQLRNLPSDLQHYLRSGSPPLVVGFGSMTEKKLLHAYWSYVIEACNTLNITRVVFQISGGNEHSVPADAVPGAFIIDYPVSHFDLFEYSRGVVHHGGSGTTHQTMARGKPQCILSFTIDQPLWGDRIRSLNLGDHVDFNANVGSVRECIRRLDDEDVVANATKLAKEVEEDRNNTLDNIVSGIYSRLPSGPVNYHSLEYTSGWKTGEPHPET